jgi:hypothetical protein
MALGFLTGRSTRSARSDAARRNREADELYEMANLYPRSTGLPMVIWVSQQGRARHDARVKVATDHNNKMDISRTAVVGVRPAPRLIEGQLAAADLTSVSEWITLNEAALVQLWDGQLWDDKIDFAEFVAAIKPV